MTHVGPHAGSHCESSLPQALDRTDADYTGGGDFTIQNQSDIVSTYLFFKWNRPMKEEGETLSIKNTCRNNIVLLNKMF